MKLEARSHVKKGKKKKKRKRPDLQYVHSVQHTECMLEGNMKPKNKHFLT